MANKDILFKRRSIRTYTGEKCSKPQLEEILKAAYASPAGMGRYETLHLTVLENPEILAKIDGATSAMMEKLTGNLMEHPLYGAPTLIIVSSVKPEHGKSNSAYSNAAIIVQNMALCATALDLGCVHIWGAIAAVNQSEDILTSLDLPEGFVPCCALAVGKTEETYDLREIPMDRIKTDYIN